MVKNKRLGNEKGLTFAEVIICVFIVALIIGPIAASFASSTKNRETAGRINEATVHAEKLLEQIKSTMTTDIIEQQKRDGNILNLSTLTPEQQARYNNVVSKYLKNAPENETVNVSDFLETTDSALLSEYDTEKYAYEILIWNIHSAPISSGTLKLDNSALASAFKLYTSESYKVTSTSANLPVTFNVSSDVLKMFKDSTNRYIPNFVTDGDKKFEVKDVNEVTISSTMSITSTSSNSRVKISNPKEIRANGIIQGYVLEIDDGTGVYNPPPSGVEPISIINLDVTQLLRDPNSLAITSTYDGYTLKFVNKTSTKQIIRVKRSAATAEDISTIDKRLNIIVKDIDGKSSIERINEVEPYDNYVVAMIVRELTPVIGEEGKVIKKMLDVYSYDVTVNERR